MAAIRTEHGDPLQHSCGERYGGYQEQIDDDDIIEKGWAKLQCGNSALDIPIIITEIPASTEGQRAPFPPLSRE